MTEKDKIFLERLRNLMESKDLRVELKPGNPSSMILKGTYGDKIHETFGVTRQGVRWRFHHLFSYAYVKAFETIVFIETTFGTQLREHAIRISRERYALRQEAARNSLRSTESIREK
jgi:hypothetical protein